MMDMMPRIALLLSLFLLALGAAHAETNELRISKGFGMHYLPLYVTEHERLIEKHAAAAGLGDIKVVWSTIDGGNVFNDAMLAGALDVASLGEPCLVSRRAEAPRKPGSQGRALHD